MTWRASHLVFLLLGCVLWNQTKAGWPKIVGKFFPLHGNSRVLCESRNRITGPLTQCLSLWHFHPSSELSLPPAYTENGIESSKLMLTDPTTAKPSAAASLTVLLWLPSLCVFMGPANKPQWLSGRIDMLSIVILPSILPSILRCSYSAASSSEPIHASLWVWFCITLLWISFDHSLSVCRHEEAVCIQGTDRISPAQAGIPRQPQWTTSCWHRRRQSGFDASLRPMSHVYGNWKSSLGWGTCLTSAQASERPRFTKDWMQTFKHRSMHCRSLELQVLVVKVSRGSWFLLRFS